MDSSKVAREFQKLMERYSQKWAHVDGLLKSYKRGVGMGGSSLPLRILEDIGALKHRHSTYWECLPNKPRKAVLVSYSGNTEEVLSYVDKLEDFWAITSGGELGKRAKNVLQLDKGFIPRAAVVEMLPLILRAYGKSRLLEKWLSYEEPNIDGLWKKIKNAKHFVSYGFEHSQFPAYYFKVCFNENAKVLVTMATLPEDNHSGIETLKGQTILIWGTPKSPRVKKRVEFLKERFGAIQIEGTPLELAHIALSLSLRMAKHRGIKDPDKSPYVAELKTYLKA